MKTILTSLVVLLTFSLTYVEAGQSSMTRTRTRTTQHMSSGGSHGSYGALGIRKRIDRRQARREDRQDRRQDRKADRQDRMSKYGFSSNRSVTHTRSRSTTGTKTRGSSKTQNCPSCGGLEAVPNPPTPTKAAPDVTLTPIKKEEFSYVST